MTVDGDTGRLGAGRDERPDDARTLRSAGLRATGVRVAVLAALRRQPHADTETVIAAARTELGTVSPQAVYNVLAALVHAGLARRIEPAGSVPLYELRVGDNHHHVVCRRCGTVGDVDCAVGRRPCLTPSQAHGFVLDEAEVTYWGLCPDCQTAPPPAGAGAPPAGAGAPPAGAGARARVPGEVDMGPQSGEEKRSGARRETRERGGGDE